VHTLLTPIQHSPGIPIRQEEEIKEIQIGKEDVKLSLLVHNMILYLKDQKNSTKKLLDTINNFTKVAGYKINLQNSVQSIYKLINNEQIEKEYGKIIPFIIASKNP
jgi:hypothetical protein